MTTASMPTILQILPSLESGGVERGTLEITHAIAQAGMRPLVVSSGGVMAPMVPRMGGQHIDMPVHSKNPLTIYRNAHLLHTLIVKEGVSLIHARSRAPAWAAYLAAKRAGIPFITTFHGIYSGKTKIKRHYNSVMTRGARVIAISEFVREHILATYPIAAEQIRLIPRGVDFTAFDPTRTLPDRIVALAKSWHLPDDHVPILFCPGRISRIKGQHVLVEALAQLKDIPFLCIIAGKDDGHEDYRMGLEQQILAHGMGEKIRICNSTSFMNEAYTLSELVLVPSIKPEAFGRIAIEAQAMGKLVIATDHGGARETVIPNETGYLVPPHDATTMAEAIRFALTRDEATKAAMAAYAQAHIRARFSITQMQEKTIAVYRELLDA